MPSARRRAACAQATAAHVSRAATPPHHRAATSTRPDSFPSLSSYEHGEDKRRIHAAGNHFILSRSQWHIITAEMIADGLAVDDRSKRAAEVAHIIASVALLDHEVVAR